MMRSIRKSHLIKMMFWLLTLYATQNNCLGQNKTNFPIAEDRSADRAKTIADFSATQNHDVAKCQARAFSAKLSCIPSADFSDGHGVRLNHAGKPFGFKQPTGFVATTCGRNQFHLCTRGTSQYTYSIASLDGRGGFGMATKPVVVPDGPAKLSINNFVSLSWHIPNPRPGGYAIYGGPYGARQVLLALLQGDNSSWNDYGLSPVKAEDWLPDTPPSAAASSWLDTTIESGGGTAEPVLALAASTTVTGLLMHDNVPNINAALSSARKVEVPSGNYIISGIGIKLSTDNVIFGKESSRLTLTTSSILDGTIAGASLARATVRNLTLDGNGFASPQALIVCLLCIDLTIRDVYIADFDRFGIYLGGATNALLQGIYCERRITIGSQNDCINVTKAGSMPVKGLLISDGTFVGSGLDIMAGNVRIVGNKIIGWKFGGGITIEQDSSSYNYLIGENYAASGATTVDSNDTCPVGIESWGRTARIVGNRVEHNCGGGIVLGGQDSLVAHNLAEDNGVAGFIVRQDSAAYNASGSTFSDNEARYSGDRRFVQRYGITTIRNGRSTPSNVKLDGSNRFDGMVGIDPDTAK